MKNLSIKILGVILACMSTDIMAQATWGTTIVTDSLATYNYDFAITGSLFINGDLLVNGGLTLNGGSIPGVSQSELIVTKGDLTGPGMFNSINDALNSITDASATNPYIIHVGPGIFTENPIILQPNVHIVGLSQFASVLQASDPTQNFIIGASGATVEDCLIQGATGTGSAAFYYDQPGYFRIISCRFGQNYTFVSQGSCLYPPGSATVVSLSSANYDSAPTTGIAINGSYPYFSGVLLSDWIWQPLTPQPQLNAFAEIQGNCVLLASDTLIGAPAPLSFTVGGCGFRVYGGATLRISDCGACGFLTALNVPNRGNGASLRVTDLLCEHNTMDTVISTSAVSGYLAGALSQKLMSIAPDTPLSLFIMDYTNISPSSSGNFLTGSLNATGTIVFNSNGTNQLSPVGSISSLVNQRLVFGSVDTYAKTVTSGTGFDFTYTGTGAGTVTFAHTFSATPIVTLSVQPTTGGQNAFASLTATSASNFSFNIANNSGTAVDGVVNFIAIGPVS